MSITLLTFFLALLAGVLIAPFTNFSNNFYIFASSFWFVISFLFLTFAPIKKTFEKLFSIWIVPGALLLGMFIYNPFPKKIIFPDHCNAKVYAKVCEPLEWQKTCLFAGNTTNFYASFIISPIKISYDNNCITNFPEKILCSIVSQSIIPLKQGDIFSNEGFLTKLKQASNPGEFNYADYYQQKKITYKFTAKTGNLRWFTPKKLSPITQLKRFLNSTKENFTKTLSSGNKFPAEKSLLLRMLIGSKEHLPATLIETFRRTNTFHIIAISGLHIGIICGVFWCLMWAAAVPGKYRSASILIILWLYAIMVGLKPSIVRASLMFSGLAIAPLFNRRNHIINTLLFVALIYLLIWSRELNSLGSMLTFISVLALIIGMPLLNLILKRFKKIYPPEIYDLEHQKFKLFYLVFQYFLKIVCGTFVIWLFTWPIILTNNNLITPSSWLANLLAIPALSIVLILGFATLLFSFIWPYAAQLINFINLFCLHILIKSINFIGTFPGSFFSIKSLSAEILFFYYAALALTLIWIWKLFTPVKKNLVIMRWIGFAGLAGWFLFAGSFLKQKNYSYFKTLEIVALDVGLGDAMVIHTPENKNILIDAGVRYGSFSMGEKIVVPYLRSEGINSLDAVICSHFDRDHIGGIIEVLENLKVDKIFSPPDISLNPLAAKLKKIAFKKNIEWCEPFQGQKLFFGALTGTVLNPPPIVTKWNKDIDDWEDNTWSLVIRWEYDGHSFLSTGDATITSEIIQMETCENLKSLRSDILKIGHHGSKTSSSEKYIDVVNPALAIFSVGQNSMGLPSKKIINRFNKRKIPIFRTDKTGAIKLILNENNICVKLFIASGSVNTEK